MEFKEVVEIDFAQLPDGTLLETIQDANHPGSTRLAIYSDGSVQYADRFEADGRICMPIARSTAILSQVRFSDGARPYDSTAHLLAAIYATFCWCLDIPTLQAMLLSCFVVSTWFPEKLPIAPYVALVGLPRSGKTTALRVLDLLCRRSLLTSDITSASFYDACNRMTPTILIDETATAGDRRALFHLLRAGSTKGPVAIRKNKVFNAYGPKVVCWTELPNDAALNSRCIVIPLQETDRRNLLRPTDPKVLAHAADVRQMLQQYRFENFNGLNLPTVPGDEHLYSRTRDLYECLALPINDENIREFLCLQFRRQQDFNREPFSPVQIAVLRALDTGIHEDLTAPAFGNNRLTEGTNVFLANDGELFHVSPAEVGRVLTSLGLTERKRRSAGWFLLLTRDTRDRIHRLIRRRGLELDRSVNSDSCEFCKDRVEPRSSTPKASPAADEAALPDGAEANEDERSALRARKMD